MSEPYVSDDDWLTRHVASISWNMKTPSYTAQLKAKRSTNHCQMSESPVGQRACFVNNLPAELLIKIFCYLPWDRDNLAENGLLWNWVDITRVCRLWQETAYLSAEFWSRVPLQSAHTVARSLQLAGDVPLRLFADFKKPWKTKDALALALAHLPRIIELSITGTTVLSSGWWYVARCLCARKATNLRCLTMQFDGHGGGYGDFPGFSLFNCVPAPTLQSLELSGFALPWAEECWTFLVPSLTHLTLENCDLEYHWSTIEATEDPEEPTVEAAEQSMFDALSNLPLLQVLSITNCKMPLDLDANEFTSPIQPLAYPHLHSLTLDATVRAITRLLGNMTIPPTTSLDVSYHHAPYLSLRESSSEFVNTMLFFERHFGAHTASGAQYSQARVRFDNNKTLSREDSIREVIYAYCAPTDGKGLSLPAQTTIKHLWFGDCDMEIHDYALFAESICARIPCNSTDTSLEITQLGRINFDHMFYMYDAWYDGPFDMDRVRDLTLIIDGFQVCQLLLHRIDQPLPLLTSIKLKSCDIEGPRLKHFEDLLRKRTALTICAMDCFVDKGVKMQLDEEFGERLRWEHPMFMMRGDSREESTRQ
ncbi:unnamed protein product [Peniophora sp. CBMAI 1063]|nr:unnamed protein product [Peniophora sp. CBMAI 1063]